MPQLFNRKFQLTVGTLDVSQLKCTFHIEKTLKPTPNVATIKVHNLSPDHRKLLESNKTNPVLLQAGYADTGLHQIYFGEVRAAWSEYQKTDVITTLETGDAEEARIANLYVPLGPKVPVHDAIRACVKALGIKVGNLESELAKLGIGSVPFRGVLTDNAAKNMTDFCRAAGLEWSVQDGALQILQQGDVFGSPGDVFLLSDKTGLVGSPSVSLDKRLEKRIPGQRTPHIKTGKQVVSASCLILPELRPGRLVVFDSVGIKGGYRVERCEYIGDTHGTPWFTNIDCTKF